MWRTPPLFVAEDSVLGTLFSSENSSVIQLWAKSIFLRFYHDLIYKDYFCKCFNLACWISAATISLLSHPWHIFGCMYNQNSHTLEPLVVSWLHYNKTHPVLYGLTSLSMLVSFSKRYCVILPAWLVKRWPDRTWLQHAALDRLLSGGPPHAGSVHEDSSKGHTEGSHQWPTWPDGEDTYFFVAYLVSWCVTTLL